MPLYEYECRKHGTFEQIASIAACREPGACPECAAPAARVLSVPHFSSMARSEIIARDRNERSRHEPRVSSTPGSCSHAGPCNHGSRGKAKAKPGQLQAYKGKRPWVMEHA
jgi:putative FmdB family regulatory protein